MSESQKDKRGLLIMAGHCFLLVGIIGLAVWASIEFNRRPHQHAAVSTDYVPLPRPKPQTPP